MLHGVLLYIKNAQLFGDALKKQIAATNMAVAEYSHILAPPQISPHNYCEEKFDKIKCAWNEINAYLEVYSSESQLHT